MKKPFRPPAPGPTVGERIREARTAAGLSQSELADRVAVHGRHVSALERGIREPSRGLLVLIAGATQRPDLFPELRGLIDVYRPRRRIDMVRSAAGGWTPLDGSAALAAELWAELPGSSVSDGRLAGGLHRAAESLIEVRFLAMPPLE